MRFVPPAQYALWWRVTESCSALAGDFANVEWDSLPTGTQLAPREGGEFTLGEWLRAGNHILLTGSWVTRGDLVRHEMLHALLQSGSHPRLQFQELCGGIVLCDSSCIADGGGNEPTSPNAQFITPDSLVIKTEITPPAASDSMYDGWSTAVVSATNATSAPVWVRLAPDTLVPGTSRTFDFTVRALIAHVTPGYLSVTGDSVFFAAGETKRQAFDFRVPIAGSFVGIGIFNTIAGAVAFSRDSS